MNPDIHASDLATPSIHRIAIHAADRDDATEFLELRLERLPLPSVLELWQAIYPFVSFAGFLKVFQSQGHFEQPALISVHRSGNYYPPKKPLP